MILTRTKIQQAVKEFFTDKPVKKAWFFGSYARGEADDNSDVDVLVELDYNNSPRMDFFIWHDGLSSAINKKVDVVSMGGVNQRIWPYIQKDMALIYER